MVQIGMVIHNIIVEPVVLTAYLNPESAIRNIKLIKNDQARAGSNGFIGSVDIR